MNEIRDFRGTLIEVGDTIVYPGRGGSSLYMVEGKVVDIVETKQAYWREDDRFVTKLKVQGTGGGSSKWRGHEKLVTINVTNRVVVVNKAVEVIDVECTPVNTERLARIIVATVYSLTNMKIIPSNEWWKVIKEVLDGVRKNG